MAEGRGCGGRDVFEAATAGVGLEIGQDAAEGGGLVVGAVVVADEVEAHKAPFEHDALYAEAFGGHAEGHDVYQLVGDSRYGSEAVYEVGAEFLDLRGAFHVVEAAV